MPKTPEKESGEAYRPKRGENPECIAINPRVSPVDLNGTKRGTAVDFDVDSTPRFSAKYISPARRSQRNHSAQNQAGTSAVLNPAGVRIQDGDYQHPCDIEPGGPRHHEFRCTRGTAMAEVDCARPSLRPTAPANGGQNRT